MMTAVFDSFSANGIGRERIILATFTMEALRDAKRRYPEVRRVLHVSYVEKDGAFMVNGKASCADFKALINQLADWKTEMGLYGYNLPTSSKFTTLDLIRQLKSEGCWLSLWYIHSKEMADKFRNSGVDGFVTGMPSALRKYLGE
jgi:glycerophosphoryl diester phosphodiesterase